MQDCFLADVGDFGKFGLLRHLVSAGTLWETTLAVIWYTVPSRGERASSRYRYLENTAIVECDPRLASALRSIAASGVLGDIPSADILPRATKYFAHPVPRDAGARAAWCDCAVGTASGSDIVFLDPDNGIAEHAKSVRHVGDAELAKFGQLDATIVVYHHLHRREPHRLQLLALQQRLSRLLPERTAHLLWYRRGGSRVFLVAPRRCNDSRIAKRLRSFVAGPWAAHFTHFAA